MQFISSNGHAGVGQTSVSWAIPAGTQRTDLVLFAFVAELTQFDLDPRLRPIADFMGAFVGFRVYVADNVAAGDPPIAVELEQPDEYIGLVLTYRGAQVSEVINATQANATTTGAVPSVNSDMAVVFAMSEAPAVPGQPIDYTSDALVNNGTFYRMVAGHWQGVAPSPVSSITFSSNRPWRIGVVGVQPRTPSTYAAPLRVFPRDDALGPGSGRLLPPPTTWQTGRRFGGGAVR